MSGIKQLFYEHNQELMEYGMPMAPSNPMMGYGGVPAYQMNPMMMQKPIKFPGFENKKKDDDGDGFWKALLAAGAGIGIGGLGLYGYNQYQKHNSGISKLGRASGNLVGNLLQQYGPDAAGLLIQHGPNAVRHFSADKQLNKMLKPSSKDSLNNNSSSKS